MDWFLVEVQSSKEPSYSIIHFLDIVEGAGTTQVKFKVDQVILTGVVVSSSKDLSLIEEELTKKLTDVSSWYLLRYCVGPKNVVHSVVHRSEVSSISVNEKGQKETCITLCNEQILATVLYVSNDEDGAMAKLRTVAEFCFEATFAPSPDEMDLETCEWFLVQYNCALRNIMFAIINRDETVFSSDNNYREEYVYIRSKSNVYSAKVLFQSDIFSELDSKINVIREMSLDLPLAPEIKQEIMETDSIEEDYGARNDLETFARQEFMKKLEMLEMKMHQEAEEISNAFQMLKQVQKGIDQHISNLDYVYNENMFDENMYNDNMYDD